MVATYETPLAEWREELKPSAALRGGAARIGGLPSVANNPRVQPTTIEFLIAGSTSSAAKSIWPEAQQAENLISSRERQIKGGRARLVNQSALDRWSGASGLGRLDFRWTIGRSHLMDLYAAREYS